MFYFYHGTTINHLIEILSSKYIRASNINDPKFGRFLTNSKYIFCNVINDEVIDTLQDIDELIGLGEISIIIDPLILKYKNAYFNFGWSKEPTKKSILLNSDNIDSTIKKVIKQYRYPYILTHEVLFKDKINNKFIIGIVINNDEIFNKINKLLLTHNMTHVKIFNRMPKLFK